MNKIIETTKVAGGLLSMPFLSTSFILAALLTSCTGKQSENPSTINPNTTIYSYADSCEHLVMTVDFEYPDGEETAVKNIQKALVSEFIGVSNIVTEYEEEECGHVNIPSFEGDSADIQSLVNFYSKLVHDRYHKLAEDDHKQILHNVETNDELTAEERQELLDFIPRWEYSYNLHKVVDNPKFSVYSSQVYIYLGGAHGGVIAPGFRTYDKVTGNRIKEFFVEDADLETLQPMLQEGLLRYYASSGEYLTLDDLADRLQIQGDLIPLPDDTPYPNVACDSLILTYGEYEIACYGDGMPTFALAIKDLKPYLNKEAKELLGI